MKISLGTPENRIIVDTNRVAYFQSDDHYAYVYYDNNQHFMLPVGLSVIEQTLKSVQQDGMMLIRFGRRYIINLQKVVHINLQRKEMDLINLPTGFYTVQLSRPSLKEAMELLRACHQGR